jgi:glycosyltransferase involved in cell wall biosynthesis
MKCIALLGCPDKPTDAVEEYCHFLSEVLSCYDIEMESVHIPWSERGWAGALRQLQKVARDWRGRSVFLQYTALAWSKHGFPFPILAVIEVLRRAGARVVVVFHDVEPYPGNRPIDYARRQLQLFVMRAMLQRTNRAIFTVQPDRLLWRPGKSHKSIFIPVGANFGEDSIPLKSDRACRSGEGLSIAVYGITGGERGRVETATIIEAVRDVATRIRNLRLVVFGRNSHIRERDIRTGLRDVGIELSFRGVLPAPQVAEELSRADVLLFVRGDISTRRGSAIAGVSCGLPVICSAGPETAPPITEAGLGIFVKEKQGDLSRVLLEILGDSQTRGALAAKSRVAHHKHFSWQAIAASYVKLLRG